MNVIQPIRVKRKPSGLWVISLLLATHSLSAQPSNIAREDFWITDGPVQAIVETNALVYLGGAFTYVGPYSGGGVLLSSSTGQTEGLFPKVQGQVYAVAADGDGGWFIGGSFTRVGGLTLTNLAHILRGRTVDTNWSPNPFSGDVSGVYALVLDFGTLYTGGIFTSIGGLNCNNLAAVDAVSGSIVAWNPSTSSKVSAMILAGDTIYVAGDFMKIAGQTRNRIAAVDKFSGLVMPWDPDANGSVLALAVLGKTVYAGGNFTRIGAQARNRIAALDTATGLSLTNWNPNASQEVRALALGSSNVVYAGGTFFNIGGQARSGLAAIEASTGRATTWNPTRGNPGGSEIDALQVIGDIVYAGGRFVRLGGQTRNNIAALDANTELAITNWNSNPNGSVLTLAANGTNLFVGGGFISVSGVGRTNIAALNAATGQATAWSPNANSNVLTLAVSADRVYAGGLFSRVGGQPRNRISALDSNTGLALTNWNPGANGSVQVLMLASGAVYAGGTFTTIGGQPRNRLASLDLTNGQVTAWDPNVTAVGAPEIKALAVSSNTVYVGGSFTNVGGQGRNNLAALDAVSATATSWNPNVNGPVSTLALSSNLIYVGGAFTRIGAQPRNNIGAVNLDAGKATAWNPNADGSVESLVAAGDIYVAGAFLNIAAQNRSGAAALDAVSGLALTWDPNADLPVRTLAVAADAIYLGGDFVNVGGRAQPGFASFRFSSTGSQVSFVSGSLRRLSSGSFEGRLSGRGGQRLVVQSSTNLTDWSGVITNTISGSPFEINFADPSAAGFARRFYRAILAP